MLLFTLRQRIQILVATIAVIAVFAAIGWFVAGGVGAIIGAVISFPVTQMVLIKTMKKEGERIAKTVTDSIADV